MDGQHHQREAGGNNRLRSALASSLGWCLSASARDPQGRPDFFDGLSGLIVVSALVVGGGARGDRCAHLRVCSLTTECGVWRNIILLATGVVGVALCGARSPRLVCRSERWKIPILPVTPYGGSGGYVPPVFGYLDADDPAPRRC